MLLARSLTLRVAHPARRFAVVLCLALVAFVSPTLVLCEGAGGHAATESLFSACCEGQRCAPSAPAPAGARATAAHDGDCLDCSDTLLLTGVALAGAPAAADAAVLTTLLPPLNPVRPGARVAALAGQRLRTETIVSTVLLI